MDAVRKKRFWLLVKESSELLIQVVFTIDRFPLHGIPEGEKKMVVSWHKTWAVQRVGWDFPAEVQKLLSRQPFSEGTSSVMQ